MDGCIVVIHAIIVCSSNPQEEIHRVEANSATASDMVISYHISTDNFGCFSSKVKEEHQSSAVSTT